MVERGEGAKRPAPKGARRSAHTRASVGVGAKRYQPPQDYRKTQVGWCAACNARDTAHARARAAARGRVAEGGEEMYNSGQVTPFAPAPAAAVRRAAAVGRASDGRRCRLQGTGRARLTWVSQGGSLDAALGRGGGPRAGRGQCGGAWGRGRSSGGPGAAGVRRPAPPPSLWRLQERRQQATAQRGSN
ncbi:MAG: hypothetical protein J3K34DRAFT_263585 [Monoraphidium minutum]|nr:MAG: hypothetical protein J3K34DRAFT_263585 [Monoraphidium minutum]